MPAEIKEDLCSNCLIIVRFHSFISSRFPSTQCGWLPLRLKECKHLGTPNHRYPGCMQALPKTFPTSCWALPDNKCLPFVEAFSFNYLLLAVDNSRVHWLLWMFPVSPGCSCSAPGAACLAHRDVCQQGTAVTRKGQSHCWRWGTSEPWAGARDKFNSLSMQGREMEITRQWLWYILSCSLYFSGLKNNKAMLELFT